MLRACVDLVCFADVLGNAIMIKSSALFVATRLLVLFLVAGRSFGRVPKTHILTEFQRRLCSCRNSGRTQMSYYGQLWDQIQD